nr:metallophosphoesterase [uncultured Bacillus sp.]
MNGRKLGLWLSSFIIVFLFVIQFVSSTIVMEAEEDDNREKAAQGEEDPGAQFVNKVLKDGDEAAADQEDFNSYPHILITEMSPNSAGKDDYEYFEVYNNTTQPLSLNNYSFYYQYIKGRHADKAMMLKENAVILPQQLVVFWYNPSGKTKADFNAKFGTRIPEEQIIEIKSFKRFYNGGNRGAAIKDKVGQTVISASYLPKETNNAGKVVQYCYPKSSTIMNKLAVLANPTPGSFDLEQVPEKPVNIEEMEEDISPPILKHKPVKNSEAYTDIILEASVKDNQSVPYATVYYKKEGGEAFTALSMTITAEKPGHFSAKIPGNVVESNLVYYIEASDGKNYIKTNELKITVAKPKVDFNKLPIFLITEIVPDSTNVGSEDGYEFIELYNNSDQDLNFKDYHIQYRYGSDPETDVMWESVPADFTIPSQKIVVFWIINESNKAKTVSDFNRHYKSQLVENQDIVKIYSPGMANNSHRGIVIATNTDIESSVAYYANHSNVDDTHEDKGITYKYPADGGSIMKKVSPGKKAATPGKISKSQVPIKPVEIPKDTKAPIFENLTDTKEIKQTDDLVLTADAQDNFIVKTVALFYKNNKEKKYKKVFLQQDHNTLHYPYTIYAPELIARKSIEYYFVVSDGTNEISSKKYMVKVNSDRSDARLRLNVKKGDILSGEEILKAASDDAGPEQVKLYIDDREPTGSTFRSLEYESYLAFEVRGVNTFFQNGVTMGDEILRIFDDWIPQWKTITVPVQPEKLKAGPNRFMIRSGDKATPFPRDNGENRDDFSLRNVRLILADGTVIRDPNSHHPEKIIAMKDSSPAAGFTFNIPGEKMLAKTYKWDTLKMKDGTYTIRAKDAVNREVSAKVKVDNTAPAIETNMEKGKEYKGKFTIHANAVDAIAGIKSTEVKLDNQVIHVPYETSSAKLSPGAHHLKMTAVDNVGNKAEQSMAFSVVDELPKKPELIAPESGTVHEGTDALLKVKVTDPTNDDMRVSFYQGFQYKPSDTKMMKVYKHAADTEPPKMMVQPGEMDVLAEEIRKISASDNDYLVTDSDSQFPYHRFDVTIDSSVDETDIVELSWEGHSLPGRKVSMYAWSHKKNKWIMLDYKIAGKEDFTLTKPVATEEFVQDSKVNVLVQDEIPASPEKYDYAFVWMSDTQYYSESYPYIYDRMTKWIVENQDAYKIKYVFHTGDLVDESNQEYQWNNADMFMDTLDEANIPNGVLAGNHDVDHKTSDYTNFYRYFGEKRYRDRSYYGGSYKNNRGHYDLISANGNDYIMVYMGWGIDDEAIAWLNQVLADHPDRKAILCFHEFLQASGTRHPMGDKLYNEVVLPNKNVFIVFSGHYHEAQTLIDEIDDNRDGAPDRKVYQVLMDYQGGPEGGKGYMRLLHFDQDQNRILVNTYSPYMNDYNYYDTDKYGAKDEFVIDLDLDAQQKRIATDSFSVNVYTDKLIDVEKGVKSGSEAEVRWRRLEPGQTYYWYTIAEDDYTGRTVSDIWSFETNSTAPSGVSQ